MGCLIFLILVTTLIKILKTPDEPMNQVKVGVEDIDKEPCDQEDSKKAEDINVIDDSIGRLTDPNADLPAQTPEIPVTMLGSARSMEESDPMNVFNHERPKSFISINVNDSELPPSLLAIEEHLGNKPKRLVSAHPRTSQNQMYAQNNLPAITSAPESQFRDSQTDDLPHAGMLPAIHSKRSFKVAMHGEN